MGLRYGFIKGGKACIGKINHGLVHKNVVNSINNGDYQEFDSLQIACVDYLVTFDDIGCMLIDGEPLECQGITTPTIITK